MAGAIEVRGAEAGLGHRPSDVPRCPCVPLGSGGDLCPQRDEAEGNPTTSPADAPMVTTTSSAPRGLVRGVIPNQGRSQGGEARRASVLGSGRIPSAQGGPGGACQDVSRSVVYDQDLRLEMEHLSGCRALARLFAAEGEIAAQEGRSAEAGRSFIDEIRLGEAAGRGGLMIEGC